VIYVKSPLENYGLPGTRFTGRQIFDKKKQSPFSTKWRTGVVVALEAAESWMGSRQARFTLLRNYSDHKLGQFGKQSIDLVVLPVVDAAAAERRTAAAPAAPAGVKDI